MKNIKRQAQEALRHLLQQVSAIKRIDIQPQQPLAESYAPDMTVRIDLFGSRYALACEVKANAQPRQVRLALLQLRNFVAIQTIATVPVLIAPYLSPEVQTLCRQHDVNFLDFEGNTLLNFGNLFIERQVSSKPATERRELRSLFKPKSAQVLRVMLRDPNRKWRTAQLAEAAEVSLGHVSNVRAGLLQREWAEVSKDGLFLAQPDVLLDKWRDAYEPPAGERLGFYTALHGAAFEQAVRRALRSAQQAELIALASFSAAHWLAPYGRTGTDYFYANHAGLERLQSELTLTPVSKGENVVVTVLSDPGLFLDMVQPAPGVICTSPVQTYLDLSTAGERGREAAEHLRKEKLRWQK